MPVTLLDFKPFQVMLHCTLSLDSSNLLAFLQWRLQYCITNWINNVSLKKARGRQKERMSACYLPSLCGVLSVSIESMACKGICEKRASSYPCCCCCKNTSCFSMFFWSIIKIWIKAIHYSQLSKPKGFVKVQASKAGFVLSMISVTVYLKNGMWWILMDIVHQYCCCYITKDSFSYRMQRSTMISQTFVFLFFLRFSRYVYSVNQRFWFEFICQSVSSSNLIILVRENLDFLLGWWR